MLSAPHGLAAYHPTTPDTELRAGERVMQYLLSEFDRPEAEGRRRLPTNKELARQLNVSLGTVQAVVRQLAREGRIQARRGSGTFLIPRPEPETVRIGIGLSMERLHDPDGWTSRIGGGLFRGALRQQATLEGISSSRKEGDKMVQELLEKIAHLDALILFPYTPAFRNQALIAAFEEAGKPVVHIYPPEAMATANFASTDFFQAGMSLGHAWQQTGRRDVAILSPVEVHTYPRCAASYQLRQLGLMDGYGETLGTQARVYTITTNGSTEEAGYDAITALLEANEPVPDAIFASGDWLALGALRALNKRGISVPDAVSLVGASGMDLSHTACPELTRVRNELESVGEAAVEMALRRVSLKGLAMPGRYIPISFFGGATTRQQENALLAISSPRLLLST